MQQLNQANCGSNFHTSNENSTEDNRHIYADQLNAAIKQAAEHIEEDPARFSTHSLRSVGATAMFRAGASPTTAKLMSRWRSDTFLAYTRIGRETIADLAAQMSDADAFREATATPLPGPCRLHACDKLRSMLVELF
ncbi:Aste57867_1961 [Aphanomyces stellatus]|uniref:Aste57867_1961 protein n=1 Tax=Aphanomyces stellatus TaxID=120398 RepID=A0A485KC16_9STRA|nr:hypothetical protein As57867_001959 [Aphanomyces stellatus]VFT79166.1 Aste57867_1961 [Aphanomyces stellatus]